MPAASPPGDARALVGIALLGARRRLNRLTSPRAAKGTRSGTARKSTGSAFLRVLLGGYFAAVSVFLVHSFVRRLQREAAERAANDAVWVRPGPGERPVVSAGALAILHLKKLDMDEFEARFRRGEAKADALARERRRFHSDVHEILARETASPESRIPQLRRASETDRLTRLFLTEGTAAFSGRVREYAGKGLLEALYDAFIPGRVALSSGTPDALALFLLLLSVPVVLLPLGGRNEELSKPEAGMEWMFSLPVSTRTLFLAHIAQEAALNPVVWVVVAPVLSLFCFYAGAGAASCVLVPLGALYLGIAASSVSTAAVTYLRARWPSDALRNLKAVLSIVLIVSQFALLTLILKGGAAYWLDAAAVLPPALWWNPFSLPALLLDPGRAPAAVLGALALSVLAVPAAATWFCGRVVSGGLIESAGGAPSSPARSARPRAASRLRGVVGKEFTLLLRDRTMFVQTLVVPALFIGWQLYTLSQGPGGLGKAVNSATLAFWAAAYMLMSSASQGLLSEQGALWLLFTVPRRLDLILLEKTYLWCAAALSAAGALLVFVPSRELSWPLAAFVLAGVAIFSFIASGVGALAVEAVDEGSELRFRPNSEAMYGFLFLASVFGWSIQSTSAWTKLVELVLCGLLAFSLWQKVRDHCPTLLDPTESPEPRISVHDGMTAVAGFFFLQLLFSFILSLYSDEYALGTRVLISFSLAGFIVAAGSIDVFWRRKVPAFWEAVGLGRGFAPAGSSAARCALWGGGAGAFAAVCGGSYLWALHRWGGALQDFGADGAASGRSQLWWILPLTVVAAPLFEEFIFRGVLYRSMSRTASPVFAAAASALLFALVHPAASALPVFVLGLAAALAFERGRHLAAPILAHAIYNFAMVVGPLLALRR